VKDYIELIRAITRATAFLLPTIALCAGVFWGADAIQDTIIGAVIGSVSTAGIFYFKKEE